MEGEEGQEGKGSCGKRKAVGMRSGEEGMMVRRMMGVRDGMAVYPLERYFSHGVLHSRRSCVKLQVDQGIV